MMSSLNLFDPLKIPLPFLGLNQLELLRPLWLLTLIPALWLIWRWRRHMATQHPWTGVCDSHLLPALLTIPKQQQYLILKISLGIGIILGIFAMAGPSWRRQEYPVFYVKQARVYVLDLSSNMLATDLKPNRYMRAKFKIVDLLKKLPEGQTGLIAFTGQSFVASPLTRDVHTLYDTLNELSPYMMPVDGENLTNAMTQAKSLLTQAGFQQGDIVLLTAMTPTSQDEQTAQKFYKQGFRTSILGMGTQNGAPIPNAKGEFSTSENGQVELSELKPKALRKFTVLAGGKYFPFTNTEEDVNQLANFLKRRSSLKEQPDQQKMTVHRDDGRWFILPLLLFVLLCFRQGAIPALKPAHH